MQEVQQKTSVAQTGETLRQSEEIFRLMVESVQDYAIFLLDPDGYICTWNLGAERIKGYAPQEIIGKHFSTFYPKEDIQSCKPQRELEEAVKEGRAEDSGWRIRKDDTKLWANVTITALKDSKGVLLGFCKVTRDMTVQNRAGELLRQSEERLRLMVESVQDYSIYMLDENGNIASWNRGAERAKGYTKEEIIGKNFSMFYTSSDIEIGKPARNLAAALREGHLVEEGWRLRKDGTRFWASIVLTPLKDKMGKLCGFAKVTRDMSDKKQAEEGLEAKVRERTRELEQINKELGQFAYVASHDLQEPLRMVAMYVDLLESRSGSKLDKDELQFLQYAAEGAQRAQQLIRDLLDYSQVGMEQRSYQVVDVKKIIREVTVNLQVLLNDEKAELEIGPMPFLNLNETQIARVFQNLIANAIKYKTSIPPVIKISAVEDEKTWIFTVQDNGIGIAPEFHEKVFELFQRLHSKSKYSGTGLGLAICKKIIERHGGKIWVESQPFKGAAFKFTLPK